MEYKAGMFVYALAFLLGVLFTQQMAVLPTLLQSLLPVLVYVIITLFMSWCTQWRNYVSLVNGNLIKYFTLIKYIILMFLLGFIWSTYCANQYLSHQLDEALVGKNLIVTGAVVGVPVLKGKSQKFEVSVDQLRIIDQESANSGKSPESFQSYPKTIRLSWYNRGSNDDINSVTAGDRWQLEVRLKPPHGFLNPGGFDYEAWLFQQGIHATGYVRQSELNKKLVESKKLPDSHEESIFDSVFSPLIPSNSIFSNTLVQQISKARQALGNRIDVAGGNTSSIDLIKALAIGDKSSISKQQWQVMRNTGISHLIAISGLHIGLAIGFSYILFRRLVPVSIIKIIPAQYIATICGLIIALLYAMIAGFSVPTQRAFLMLLVLSMMMLFRRNHRPVDSLGFALIIVLLVDPLAVLSAGFWFSFAAVAVIFMSISHSPKYDDSNAVGPRLNSLPLFRNKLFFVIKKWIRLQLLISVFLLPLSLFMFQQVSMVSPLVNLFLIPYVSFLVVPLVLLALCLAFIFPLLADFLFNLASNLLDLVWPVLTYLSEQPYAIWVNGEVSLVKLLFATLILCLLFYFKPLLKFLSKKYRDTVKAKMTFFVLPIIFSVLVTTFSIANESTLFDGEYTVTILDVGQGSSAVVQTKYHVLVFDTGARFSEKLDIGESVVIPYLRSQGIRNLDRLIVSHGDADHIGGASSVIKAFPSTLVVGQGIESLKTPNKDYCYAGDKWQWDGVSFEFLSPEVPDSRMRNKNGISNLKSNNMSCVLKVSSSNGSVLFTGDIEKVVEQRLLSNSNNKLKSDVLIIPHHGSNTSSSAGFVDAVNPKRSILSVGYKNRYRLPNNKVMSRYDAVNSEILRTDKQGAITLKFVESQFQVDQLQVEKYREEYKRYWHHELEL